MHFRIALFGLWHRADFRMKLLAIFYRIPQGILPRVLETQNVLVAIVLGAASGLSATGTNQAVKQLTSKSNTNKTE